MMPGTIQEPPTARTAAPGGALHEAPAHSMRPLATTTVALATGGAPVPSISVAPERTVAAVPAGRSNRRASRADAIIRGAYRNALAAANAFVPQKDCVATGPGS